MFNTYIESVIVIFLEWDAVRRRDSAAAQVVCLGEGDVAGAGTVGKQDPGSGWIPYMNMACACSKDEHDICLF